MVLPIGVGVGIAIKGAGKVLSKTKIGQKVLKNVIKKIQKTPDKAFRQDKTYNLSTGPGGKIIKGRTNKQKAIKQQKEIKRKFDAKGDTYHSPFKKGGKV